MAPDLIDRNTKWTLLAIDQGRQSIDRTSWDNDDCCSKVGTKTTAALSEMMMISICMKEGVTRKRVENVRRVWRIVVAILLLEWLCLPITKQTSKREEWILIITLWWVDWMSGGRERNVNMDRGFHISLRVATFSFQMSMFRTLDHSSPPKGLTVAAQGSDCQVLHHCRAHGGWWSPCHVIEPLKSKRLCTQALAGYYSYTIPSNIFSLLKVWS